MKIYQVHEYGGEYEDRYDAIIKSFMSKEKAEAYAKECEVAEEEAVKLKDKCSECLCNTVDLEMFDNFDELINSIEIYCNKFELDEEEAKEDGIDITKKENFFYVDCQNNFIHEYYEYCWFEVEEVEVEE